MSKKIIFFNSSMEMGGPARVISILSNFLSDNGYFVQVVSNTNAEFFYPLNAGIEKKVLGIDKFKHRFLLLSILKILGFVSKIKNSILIFNKGYYIIPIFILRKLGLLKSGNCFIYFAHGGSSDFKNLYNNFYNLLILHAFDRVVALHDDYDQAKYTPRSTVKTKLANFFIANTYQSLKAKLIFIPNPTTFSVNSTDECARDKMVLAVGRLDKVKGFDYLLRAWVTVQKHHPDWRLIIVGSGNELQNLQAIIDLHGLDGSASIVPQQLNIKPFYMRASVYAMSSLEEGFGMVLLEAMVAGLPIAAFSNVGSKFLIEDGVNGFLCPIANIDELSKNLLLLIENKDTRDRMGLSSRLKSSSFNLEKIGNRWKVFLSDPI